MYLLVYGIYADVIPEDSETIPAVLYIAMGTNENLGWYNNYNHITFAEYDCDPVLASEQAKQDLMAFLRS